MELLTQAEILEEILGGPVPNDIRQFINKVRTDNNLIPQKYIVDSSSYEGRRDNYKYRNTMGLKMFLSNCIILFIIFKDTDLVKKIMQREISTKVLDDELKKIFTTIQIRSDIYNVIKESKDAVISGIMNTSDWQNDNLLELIDKNRKQSFKKSENRFYPLKNLFMKYNAVSKLEEIETRSINATENIIDKSIHLMRLGYFDKSYNVLIDYLNEFPENSEAWYQLAIFYIELAKRASRDSLYHDFMKYDSSPMSAEENWHGEESDYYKRQYINHNSKSIDHLLKAIKYWPKYDHSDEPINLKDRRIVILYLIDRLFIQHQTELFYKFSKRDFKEMQHLLQILKNGDYAQKHISIYGVEKISYDCKRLALLWIFNEEDYQDELMKWKNEIGSLAIDIYPYIKSFNGEYTKDEPDSPVLMIFRKLFNDAFSLSERSDIIKHWEKRHIESLVNEYRLFEVNNLVNQIKEYEKSDRTKENQLVVYKKPDTLLKALNLLGSMNLNSDEYKIFQQRLVYLKLKLYFCIIKFFYDNSDIERTVTYLQSLEKDSLRDLAIVKIINKEEYLKEEMVDEHDIIIVDDFGDEDILFGYVRYYDFKNKKFEQDEKCALKFLIEAVLDKCGVNHAPVLLKELSLLSNALQL
jgi:hypothetical protein